MTWFGGAASAPLINDVSTDLQHPPSFRIAEIPDLPEAYKPIISAGYPDLKPLLLPGQAPGAVFQAAVAVAEAMPRWEMTHADDEDRYLEGIATTGIMRFKDDFVIRISVEGSGSIVDMRSRSRVGKGDMGCNAARIHTYFEKLRAKLTK